ncbi:iron-sulfur cluster biosynthesis family protein [Paenibacillus dokdonensis]|uniref:iron-sulfur cluster biosynthesis family protein n=1 Tax=Paenibacillus dokdonensis TaxID=2567944 RepID=UPI0010A7B134|nr:iron-sulfur cluster biosynthesis family protein [Paenibacillus dokdonensis]
MIIVIDPYTEEKLTQSLAGRPGFFKLFYDTENCGCNGVLAIEILERPLDTDVKVPVNKFTFLVDKQQESLFDKALKLEADRTYPSFKVTSDSALYSTNVRIQDGRNIAN